MRLWGSGSSQSGIGQPVDQSTNYLIPHPAPLPSLNQPSTRVHVRLSRREDTILSNNFLPPTQIARPLGKAGRFVFLAAASPFVASSPFVDSRPFVDISQATLNSSSYGVKPPAGYYHQLPSSYANRSALRQGRAILRFPPSLNDFSIFSHASLNWLRHNSVEFTEVNTYV